MKIPKSFKVFASTINVDTDDTKLSPEDCWENVVLMIIK